MKIQVGFYAPRTPDGSFESSIPIHHEIDEACCIKTLISNEGEERRVFSPFPDELDDILCEKIIALKALERKGKRNGKTRKQ